MYLIGGQDGFDGSFLMVLFCVTDTDDNKMTEQNTMKTYQADFP